MSTKPKPKTTAAAVARTRATVPRTKTQAAEVVPLRGEPTDWTIESLREEFGTRLGQIIGREDLSGLPKPEPLIESWADTGTAVLMVGATGTNKTFTLIGWACSVVTGEPWLGHEVAIEPSPVIYVVGEGASRFDERIAAWEAESGVEVPRDRLVHLIRPQTSIKEEKFWKALQKMAIRIGARLIIMDTFSSLAPDVDETTEAAAAIRRMTDLAVEIDGAVVLAHHTGWSSQNRARGGSQLEANADSVIVLTKDNDEDDNSDVTIWRKKDKDGPAGRRIRVARMALAPSCVLEVLERDVEPVRRRGGTAQVTDSDIRAAILDFIEAHPNTTASKVKAGVVGKLQNKRRVERLMRSLTQEGKVWDVPGPVVEAGRTVTRPVLVTGPIKASTQLDPATLPVARAGSVRSGRKPTRPGNLARPKRKGGEKR